jgi:predicted permease
MTLRVARTVHYAQAVNVLGDLRYALRTLRSSPGFTCAALLTLALGIAANTAVYSVVDGVLLHPVPFPEPDRLVALFQKSPASTRNSVSYLNLLDWQSQSQTFEGIAGTLSEFATLKYQKDQPEPLEGQRVSSNFFSVLRIHPVIGRAFTAEEDKLGSAPVILLGEDFWRRRFSANRGILGRTLTIDGRETTVIGIVPRSVRLERDKASFENDYFAPLGQVEDPLFSDRGIGYGTLGLGRLKPGASLDQAQAEMSTIMQRLDAEYPDANRTLGAMLISYPTMVSGDLRPVVLALCAAVGFVLLIACTNIANLALARSVSRSREFAVRMALGAGRATLIRQLLIESAVLSLGAGALGVLAAAWATDAALAVLPTALPAIATVQLNHRVLFFSLCVSMLSGVLFGLAPALKAGDVSLHESLKQGGRGNIQGRYPIQRSLIVAEISLTLVLLVGSGLMLRSLDKLWNTSPGFNPEQVSFFYTGLSDSHTATPGAIRESFRAVDRRLAAIPGVQAASVQIGGLPLQGGGATLGFRKVDDPDKQHLQLANLYAVGPDHFRAMGIPLLRGRPLNAQDTLTHPLVVIVDEELARRTFPGQDPLGKSIFTPLFGRPSEIVGVAGHLRHGGLDSDDGMQFYYSYMQLPDSILPLAAKGFAGIVRSPAAPAAVLSAVRRELSAFDPDRAVHNEETMTELVSASLARRRFSLMVLGAFAAAALLLALVGIYGVVSYFVRQRTSEIGVRLALGAQRRAILFDVVGDGARLCGAGIALGLVGSAALTRLLRGQLFGVSPLDPATFTAAAAIVLALALLACYIPARRAVRISPMAALRCE